MSNMVESNLSRRLPTDAESASAKEAIGVLAKTRDIAGKFSFGIPEIGESIELPDSIAYLMLEMLTYIAKGEAVTFVPIGAELSTQRAADLLNVSRPFLIKLIEQGEIPCVKVGTHRRVRALDVLAYLDRRDRDQEAALVELARLGQKIEAG